MSPLPRKVPRIAENRFTAWLQDRWYGQSPIAFLKPFASLFHWLAQRRRQQFNAGIRPIQRLPVPVIVIGNIVVGGAGKTPTVLATVAALKQCGLKPGILSRGYGASRPQARRVTSESTPADVGDEPLLLHLQSGVPVAVGADRFAAGQLLLRSHPEINCIVSDDGLQHYGLYRDVELVVIARDKGMGNGAFIPAGPLREPISRLSSVDAVIFHGSKDGKQGGSMPEVEHILRDHGIPQFHLKLTVEAPVPFKIWKAALLKETLHASYHQQNWSVWFGNPVHAVAGIAHPRRFFSALEQHGMRVTPHAFSDHHRFQAHQLTFPEPYPIMMTEKDAVKCFHFDLDRHWVVPLHAELDPGALEWLKIKLETGDGPQTA